MKVLKFFCIACLLFVMESSQSYPPAPHHMFFGTVRDELGNPIAIEDAEVILSADSGATAKARIRASGRAGVNYELPVSMDAGITRDLYRPSAMRPTVPFRIQVRIGQVVYLPIEMAGDLALMGQPSQTTRLNLTLGEDSDGDGLPDAWERALAQNGKQLSDINPNDDADGDGLSNIDDILPAVTRLIPRTVLTSKLLCRLRGRSWSFFRLRDVRIRSLDRAILKREIPFLFV